MREEESTCQVFAAVAVDALWRSFETAVEQKQGTSQLERLCAELTREEQQKQLRREQKKLKRKRKKGKLAEQDGKDNCNDCECAGEFDDKDDTDKDCSCSPEKSDDNIEMLNCNCEDLSSVKNDSKFNEDRMNLDTIKINKGTNCKKSNCDELWSDECKCDRSDKKNGKKSYKYDSFLSTECNGKKENGNSSDHSHDCGYSSENNNGCCETGSLISSLPSSPEGSEVACSESCCQHEYTPLSKFHYGNGHQLSLQEMLEVSK